MPKMFWVTARLLAEVRRQGRWMRNFSITGPGVSTRRSPDAFTAVISPTATPPTPAAGAAGSSLARVKATSTTGVTGTLNCKQVTKDTTTVTGAEFAVQLTQGHAVGDVFFAIKSANGSDFVGVDWVEHLMLAVDTHRYRLVQVLDNTGRLGVGSARYE